MNKILLVDDDSSVLEVIKLRMEHEEFQVHAAKEYEGAVHSASREAFDLALVDLKLYGKSGIDLMEELHRIHPDMPVIILTGYGSVNSAVDAMKRGACTYLTKPFDFEELFLHVRSCLEKTELSKEVNRLKDIVGERFSFSNIIGKSEKMQKVMTQVVQAADSDSIVYISGESGTGKELIAKSLHLESPRKDGPFVAINCAAIPDTLLESELFGHERGAFTGAEKRKAGLFAKAHGGTFFSMKFQRCRQTCRPSCCVCWRIEKSIRWAAQESPLNLMPESWLPPIKIWRKRSKTANSVRICITASM
jgi:two-component system response regulator GlrR